MEQDKKVWIVVIAVGILAILFGTCLGALAGGVIGYRIGQKAGRAEQYKRQLLPEQTEPPTSLPPESGALVTKVVPDGPADSAGIRAGDWIIAVDGVRVDVGNTLQEIVRKHQPGDRVKITLWREGRERTVNVKLGENPEEKGVAYLGVFYTMPMRVEEPETH